MMKKSISFLLLLASLSRVFAQDIPLEIKKSVEFEDAHKQSTIILTKEDGKGGVTIVRAYKGGGIAFGEGFYIEHYDADLSLKKDFEFNLDLSKTQKFTYIVGIMAFGNNINIIDLHYDLNQRAFLCQANVITDDFKVSKKELFRLSRDEIKEIGALYLDKKFYEQSNSLLTFDNYGTIQSEIAPPVTGNQAGSEIAMVVNENSSAFAIGIDLNGKKSEFLKLYLFDSNLNKTIDTDFKREVKDEKYVFQNFQVSPAGDAIYLLGKSYADELKNKEKGGKYLFELTKITASSQTPKSIDPGEHYLRSMKMIFQNNRLICLGLYSDISENTYSGISYFSLDSNTLDIRNARYNHFTEQFFTDKFSDRTTIFSLYSRYIFKGIFFTANNELIFNAEEESIVTPPQTGIGTGMASGGKTYYECNDILTAKLDADGKMVWARNLNKDQTDSVENGAYLSYTSIFLGGSTYFFINAADRIKKLHNDRIKFGDVRKNKSNLNVIRMNPDSNFDYQEILSDESSVVPFMVAKGTLVGDSLFFLGRKGKTKQLLKITLK